MTCKLGGNFGTHRDGVTTAGHKRSRVEGICEDKIWPNLQKKQTSSQWNSKSNEEIWGLASFER